MFKTSTDRKICIWEMDDKKHYSDADEWVEGCKFITVLDRHCEVSMLVFPAHIVHNDMYRRKFGGTGILSAGFISFSGIAHGRSTSIAGSPRANSDDSDALIEFVEHLNQEWNK